MNRSIGDRVILNNGSEIPWLGLGLYKMQPGGELERAVEAAIEAGYRCFDTATFYANEASLGKALRYSGLRRDEYIVTTKLWNSDHGFNNTLEACGKSLEALGTDYIDLYLIHWPVPGHLESWKAMEKLLQDGTVGSIGVSNFTIQDLNILMEQCDTIPVINQVEFHPLLYQKELLEFCRDHDIELQAWRPLTQGKIFNDPAIQKLAETYGRTPAQIILRWHLELGILTIPKSKTPHRIRENAGIFDFELTGENISAISALNRNERLGPDPETFGR